jgi:hypothetical protein
MSEASPTNVTEPDVVEPDNMGTCDVCKARNRVKRIRLDVAGYGKCQYCFLFRDRLKYLETAPLTFDTKIKCPECPLYGASVQLYHVSLCPGCYDGKTSLASQIHLEPLPKLV